MVDFRLLNLWFSSLNDRCRYPRISPIKSESGYWGARFRNDCDKLLIFQFFDVEQTIEFLKVTQDSSGRMFISSSRTFQSGQNPVFSSIAKRFFRYIFWEWEGTLKRFLSSFFFLNYKPLKNAHQRLKFSIDLVLTMKLISTFFYHDMFRYSSSLIGIISINTVLRRLVLISL